MWLNITFSVTVSYKDSKGTIFQTPSKYSEKLLLENIWAVCKMWQVRPTLNL